MNRSVTASLLASALLLLAANGQAANWVAGTHYSVLPQAQRTSVPAGKIEVLEVFSYGCPHCRQFQPTIKKLKEVLPANVQIAYLPASWNKAENWPLFQRAFLTAQEPPQGHATGHGQRPNTSRAFSRSEKRSSSMISARG